METKQRRKDEVLANFTAKDHVLIEKLKSEQTIVKKISRDDRNLTTCLEQRLHKTQRHWQIVFGPGYKVRMRPDLDLGVRSLDEWIEDVKWLQEIKRHTICSGEFDSVVLLGGDKRDELYDAICITSLFKYALDAEQKEWEEDRFSAYWMKPRSVDEWIEDLSAMKEATKIANHCGRFIKKELFNFGWCSRTRDWCHPTSIVWTILHDKMFPTDDFSTMKSQQRK